MDKIDTVLIVDDDEIALLLLKENFESAGFNVITTTESIKTVKLYEKYNPIAVVIDIFMPEKDGIDLVKELKKLNIDVPVIAVSSHNEFLQIITDLGADHAFSKFDPIKNIVQAVVDRQTN